MAVPVPEDAAAKDFLAFRVASETFHLITSYFSSQLRPKKPSFVFFNLFFLPSHSRLLVRLILKDTEELGNLFPPSASF